MSNQFAIFDWAGNRLTRWGEFPSFEEAWDYIFGDMTDILKLKEEDYQEYFVEELTSNSN
jgi:hypothetical protein